MPVAARCCQVLPGAACCLLGAACWVLLACENFSDPPPPYPPPKGQSVCSRADGGTAQTFYFFYKNANLGGLGYIVIMFYSIPLTTRSLRATEARLQSIYDAAKLGLKGDSLALASGMLPTEFRQLCQLDPLAEMAEQKGRADSEMEASSQLREAARSGDAKAALAILTHTHGWVAKQSISVEVEQRISITGALELAQKRVESLTLDANHPILGSGRNGADGAYVDAIDKRQPVGVRNASVSVGPGGDTVS